LLDAANVPECDDGDQCTTATCDLSDGCVQHAAESFPSVSCRLGTLSGLLADESVTEKGRTSLQKLLDKSNAQLAKAATSTAPAKKVVKILKKARKKVISLRKKAEKLTGTQITDLTVARAIVNAASDAEHRVDALMEALVTPAP
jgi:hypothetical protein